MIILPDLSAPRGSFLMPLRRKAWMPSSEAQPKDQFGRENSVTYAVKGRLSDGKIAWSGFFNDREDFDAFLWALVTGSLLYERELWRLPTPWWHPDFGENLTYHFATYVTLTSPTGSNQTYTSAADWNNSNNSIYTVGGGAGGQQGISGHVTGGGGGACNSTTNFTFAVPGTTTATWQAAAAQIADGGLGNDTWFNNTTLAGSTVGSKGGTGGVKGSGSQNGGAGGVAASGTGTAVGNGGRGGNLTGASGGGGSGGGGAAGINGVGGNGGDDATTGASVSTAGGRGDNSTGGAGATANSSAAGSAGTEFGNGTHGSGGGSAGCTSVNPGSGGNYGAGGGGRFGSGSGGDGAQGMVFLIYTPATGGLRRGVLEGRLELPGPVN